LQRRNPTLAPQETLFRGKTFPVHFKPRGTFDRAGNFLSAAGFAGRLVKPSE